MKSLNCLSFSIFVLCIICLSGPCNGEDEDSGAPMKKTEKEALYSAIQSFVGKWWNGSDLYPDPCGWTPIQATTSSSFSLCVGVSCDLFNGFWYATDLSIGPVHDNSLTCAQNVEFSQHLFALRHLRSLSFFNCFTSLENPVSIPTQKWELLAERLESLEFRSNYGLTGEIPVAFEGLRNLQSLVLMENGLTGELPKHLGNLTNLKRLNLAGNSFTGRIPDGLGGLTQLLILDISRNALSGSLPPVLGGLISLLKLDLSNNQLEGVIPDELGKLKSLTLLDMSNNRLSGGLSKSLEQLVSLQELILSNNPTGGDIMSLQWQNLMSLTALDLSNMSLAGGIPGSIGELKALRFLGLSDNELIGDIPTKLGNLPNVSAIYIHGNNLTGELKFSEWFYGKLGRRFGAWGNPNLCYKMGSIQTTYAPFGVKQCREDVNVMKYKTHLDPKMDNGNLKHDQTSMTSSASSVCWVNGLAFVVKVLMILVLNLSF